MRDEGLSQARAAARLRMPASWLRRFLSGRIRRLRTATIRRIATGLGQPDELIRLALASDEADQAARELDRALRAAGPHLAGDRRRTKIEEQARNKQLRLAALERFVFPTVDDHAIDRVLSSLSRRQKLALMVLIGEARR